MSAGFHHPLDLAGAKLFGLAVLEARGLDLFAGFIGIFGECSIEATGK
jgi:hypothetical protein